MDTMTNEYLDYDGVSERTGIQSKTLRVYLAQANRRREEGTSKPGDIPPPDEVFGQSPVWKPATIDKWLARRPGRGVGGAAARELKRERARYLEGKHDG